MTRLWVIRALAVAALAFCGVARVAAQMPDLLPQRGVYPNGAYTFDKLETINKYNGILTYSIPITSMPLGRGGMTVPVKLVYSSALADYFQVSGTLSGQPVTYGEAQASAFGGWSFQGFNYSLYEVSLPTIVCTAYTNNGNTVPVSPPPFQLGIIMPDGAHHVLKLYGQTDTYGNGTYWFNPQNGEDPCTSQTLASPLTYYTTDGSYIRVSVNTSNPGAYPAGGPYTIYLPNGMEISSAGWGTWASGQPFAATSGNSTIRDRNGNQVKVTLNANNTTTLTDDLGRTVTVGNSAVTQTGFGGSPLSWTLGNYFSVETGAACQTPGVYGCGKFPAGGPQFLQVPSDTGTLQYQFGYDPTSGELTSVTLPSGATTSYTYGGGSYATTVGLTLFYSTVVTGKQVTWLDQSDGGSTKRSETWGYNYGCPAGPPCTTTITAPDGGAHTTSFYGASPLAAMVTKETLPDGSATETMYEQNPAFYEAAISAGGTDSANPFVALVVHTVASNGQPTLAAVEQRMIDQNGNLASDTEYDWIPYAQLTHDTKGRLTGFSGGSSLRSTTNTYLSPVPLATNGAGPPDVTSGYAPGYWNPAAPLLRGLLSRSATNGAGPGAIAEFSYDGNGNQYQERHWDSTKAATQPASLTAGNASVVHRTFDSYGNVTEVGDANGNFTDFTYDANNLYPITEVDAHKTPVQRTFQYSWDYNVGVVTSKTDQDNSITTTYSYDPQGRQTQVVEDSVGLQRQTNTTYNDAALQVIVKRDQVKSGDGVLVSTTTYDQLYRPTLAQDASGSKVQTRYLYGGSNSYKLVSNPFQAATSAKATAEPTMGWTLSTFDQNGRLVSAQSYNGNALPTPFGGGNTSTSGTVTTSYSSNTTTVTDQVGNARTTTVDGAGRLVGVVEDPGATGHFNYTTSYTYDALDDLSGVNQSGLTRTFTYDSLKRLANAVNPESGSISYTYDANGNLLTRLDARGYTTKYGPYDALNRSAGKTYTDGTPAVSYTYDSGGLYSIGHLTAVANAYSSTSYGSFDALGRVGTSVQTTGGPSYTFSYGYNLGGALTSETYPSKRMVTTAPDAANRPSAVGGKLGTIGTNYVANVLYASHGAPLSYVYGNNVARTNSYNGRLQMGGYIDTNNKTMVQLVNATLTWGVANDNGNLQTATYANGGTGTPASLTFTQTFGYDNVNRLISASDNGGWSRNFGYDAFGNQWVSGSSGIRLAGNTPTSGSAFNANNQIAATPSSYDASGNQKLVNGNTPTYDAENRQTSVTFGGLTESYFYDGSGQRVEKTGPSGTTVFVYDALGMLAAEYSTAGNASPCATCYLSGDHLGSTRLVTDGSGNVIGRHDYLPFGEEIAGNAAGRNGQWGAGNDLVEQKFTGKERDAESGLDYFGARYYGSALGRWTSPDKLNLTSARLLSPTNTLNKYAYAANNPLKFIDPDGRDVTIFYRPPTSFPFDFGHVLIGALNQSTGKAGFLDYYPRGGGNGPGQFNLGTMQERAAARDQFLTLTVQTSPEEAQQVLDLITKLTGSNPPDYAALSNNCTTVCQDVLHDLGLDFGDVFPKDYWADVYRNFSPAVWDNPFKAFFVPTKPGMEYGNPRNVGTDFATFLFQVYLNQQLNKPVTACVDAHDDKGNSTGQTCSQ